MLTWPVARGRWPQLEREWAATLTSVPDPADREGRRATKRDENEWERKGKEKGEEARSIAALSSTEGGRLGRERREREQWKKGACGARKAEGAGTESWDQSEGVGHVRVQGSSYASSWS